MTDFCTAHLYRQLRLSGLLLASLFASTAHAQTPAPPAPATYTGPRYPGGPDSLAAQLQRSLRPASPTPAGQLFVRLELDAAGKATTYQVLKPAAGTPAAALFFNPAALAAVQKAVSTLSDWQLGAAPAAPAGAVAVTLPLTLGAAAAAQPALVYSEEEPVLPAGYLSPAPKNQPTFGPSLSYTLQRRLGYPVAALRRREEGTVYAYFEVSETGAIEQPRIIGSAGSILDAEVLRMVQTIPAAVVPPRSQGRPVRIYYVLPFAFRLQ
ncbi:MAG: energy transducer TonB [Janthinobacterium lividum]